MEVRFEDHPAFQRAALLAAAGGAALGATGSLPLAAAGSAVALTLGITAVPWRWRILAACACVASAVVWGVAAKPWSAPAFGAMLGLVLAGARADAVRRSGGSPVSPCAVVAGAAAASIAFATGAALLPDLTAALSTLAPSFYVAACSGAVLGLWTAISSAPVHLRIGGDRVEESPT